MRPNALVECMADFIWEDIVLKLPAKGPSYGEICTVLTFDDGYITLKEYTELAWDNTIREYEAKYFREIQPPMTIDISEVQHQTQTV